MASSVTIVIPFRNAAQTLARTLDSLQRQETGREVSLVLVDDHSDDGSAQLARQHPVCNRWQLEVLANAAGGLANAYNLGWKASNADVIITMHADCTLPSPRALESILQPFDNPQVCAALPVVTGPADEWDAMSFWDRVANARFMGMKGKDLSGKFDAIRRTALAELEGFDGIRFFSAGEDIDMYLRLRRFGEVVNTEVEVVHGHVYPKQSRLASLFRKQAQLAMGFGALLRRHPDRLLEYPLRGHLVTHGIKAVLLAGLLIPAVRLPSLVLLLLLGAYYSRRALLTPDPRVLLVPFVNIGQFAVFIAYVAWGLITGRQTFYYR